MKYLVVQVFWYFDQVTGEFNYRIRKPGEILAQHPDFLVCNIHLFHPLFSQLALAADLLILHLLADEEVGHIIALRKKLGKPTIYEIPDNFLSLGPWVGTDDALRNPQIRQNFLFNASQCDALQLSSPELQKTFGYLNPRTQVFENQTDQFSAPSPGDTFVFGWGGSKGHEADLAEVAPAIERFCRDHPDAVFSYMGYEPIFQRYFAQIPNAQCRPGGPIEDYYAFLEHLEVGMAPLRDTEFNRCRSDVKFLEYAAHGVVPVLSDAACYRVHGEDGQNCFFFKDPDQLYARLAFLYRNAEERRAAAQRAYDYASVKRSLSNHLDRRASFYKTLLFFDPNVDELPLLPDCEGLIGYIRKVTYLFEACRLVEAMELLAKVLEMHPTFPQAHMWRLRTMVKGGHLEEALATYRDYEVSPIYWDILHEQLAIASFALGDPNWREHHRRILSPVTRLRLEPTNRLDREMIFRQILDFNPYHYDSLVSLSILLSRGGKPQEALGFLRRAERINPEEIDVDGALAKLLNPS